MLKKRLAALLLTLAMVVTYMPTLAFATDAAQPEGEEVLTEETAAETEEVTEEVTEEASDETATEETSEEAVVTDKNETYKVEFQIMDKSGDYHTYLVQTVEEGGKAEKPAVTTTYKKDGSDYYAASGYWQKKGGTGTYVFDNIVESDLVLQARYNFGTVAGNKSTATFHSSKTANDDVKIVFCGKKNGNTDELPNLYEGETVTGWTDEDGNLVTPAYKNNDYYAVFAKPDKFEIKYLIPSACDGMGTVSSASEDVEASADAAKGSKAEANPGYEFVGWFDNADGTGTALSTEAEYAPDKPEDGWADATYYAVFKEKDAVKIVFEVAAECAGMGTVSPRDISFNPDFGPTDGSSTAEANSGYEFVEWQDESGETVDTNAKLVLDEPDGGWADATYSAVFAPSQFNVTFNYNFGETPETEVVKQTYNTNYVLPENEPKRPGYDFDGWFTDSTSGTEITDKEIFDIANDNTILYAHWTLKENVEIKYLVNDEDMGSVTNASDLLNPDLGEATGSAAKANDGYHFNGWFNTIAGTGDAITTDEEFVPEKPEGGWVEATYYAVFAPDEFTINYFDKEGNDFDGIHEEGYPQKHYYGADTKLDSPSKTGYQFAGYYDASGDAGKKVETLGATDYTDTTEAINLYANWTANNYTVVFHNGDATADAGKFTYDVPQALKANPFTKDGYTFNGWKAADGTEFDDEEEVENLTDVNDGVVDLYAQWTANDYEIVFDGNDEAVSGSMSNQKMTYDESDNLNANEFTLRGYNFTEWNTEADGSGTGYADKAEVINLAKEGTVTLYAQWTEKKHVVLSYAVADGCAKMGTVDPASEDLNPDASADGSKATANEGYHFENWVDENDEELSTDEAFVPEIPEGGHVAATFFAVFAPNDDTAYTVEHYQQLLDGTYELADTDNLTGTTDASANAEPKEYYGFTLNEDESVMSGTIAPDGSLVLTLKYDRNEYTASFDANGGEGTADDQVVKYEDKILEPNTIARVGYTLVSWNTEADGSGTTWDFENDGLTEDTILYAQWTADEAAIIFDENGGSEVDDLFGVTDEIIEDRTMPETTREGYNFLGWIDEDGNIVEELPEAFAPGVVVYTAQWEEIPAPTPDDDDEDDVKTGDMNNIGLYMIIGLGAAVAAVLVARRRRTN